MSTEAPTRRYEAEARSTEVFGRMLCRARHQHFVSDGPATIGCPGEAVSPGELFLAGIASCGVELVEVFAREEGVPLEAASVAIWGDIDPADQPRAGVTVFTRVGIDVELAGVTQEQAEHLVGRFKGR